MRPSCRLVFLLRSLDLKSGYACAPELDYVTVQGSEIGWRTYTAVNSLIGGLLHGVVEIMLLTSPAVPTYSGVNIGSLFALIEGGGDVGTLGLARLSTRERHPLAKDPRAIGAFFRKNLAPGQPLGFYSGILLSTEALDEWMETLPTFTSTSHQSGMSIDATITARADVKSQADNLCEMHNNPNPNESVKAAFAQDHTVVSKSPVDSFTPHIPQRVELMNMSVQELQRRLLACDVEFDSSGSKIDFVEALLSLPPSKSVYLDTSVLCLHEVLVHMDAEEIMQRLRPIVGCPVITDQKKKNELMQVVVEVAISNKRVALQKAFPEWLDGTCTGNTTKHSDTVVRALPVPSIDVVSSPTGYPVDDASSLLCKSLVWSYDCAATEVRSSTISRCHVLCSSRHRVPLAVFVGPSLRHEHVPRRIRPQRAFCYQ